MMRYLTTACFFCFFMSSGLIAQKSKIPSNYQGLLWEISGNGLTKPSYLYGTMHVSDKMAYELTDSFYTALANVDVVALEIDFGQWLEKSQQEDEAQDILQMSLGITTSGGFYRKITDMRPYTRERMEETLRDIPDLINPMLFRSNSRKEDFEERTYLDLFIYQAGKKLGKEVTGLENYLESERLTTRGQLESKEFRQKTKSDAEKDEFKAQASHREYILQNILKDLGWTRNEALRKSYQQGNLDLLDTIYKLDDDDPIYKRYLLDERNFVMVRSIDSIVRNKSLFSAVGAAHLPGHTGVIELLRAKGYTVRSVKGKAEVDRRFKDLIENVQLQVKFENYTSPDSAFSVRLPFALQQQYANGHVSGYLTNDFTNGSFYTITRIRHLAPINGHHYNDMRSHIDSLLYQNIPGDIIEKNFFMQQGQFPGIDILNKRKKGDYERYRIIISPLEIFVFKISGNADYIIKCAEDDTFFNSVVILPMYQETSWREYTGTPYPFSIRMPEGGAVIKNSSPAGNIKLQMIATSHNGEDIFQVNYGQYFDCQYIEQDTFEYQVISDVFASRMEYETDTSVWGNDHNGTFYQTFYTTPKGIQLSSRTYISGGNYFFLLTNATGDNADRFFNSLQISGFTTQFSTSEIYRDTISRFTAEIPIYHSEYADMYRDLYREFYGLNYKSSSYAQKVPNRFTGKILKESFYDPVTGERVILEGVLRGIFDQYADTSEFRKFAERSLKKVSHEFTLTESSQTGNTWKYTYRISREGSRRVIWTDAYYTGNAVYRISCMGDSATGPGIFADNFRNTFVPFESSDTSLVSADQALQEYFFTELYNRDSSDRSAILNALSWILPKVKTKHGNALREMIAHPSFNSLPMSDKKEIIEHAGSIADDEMLKFLRKLYYNNFDSVNIQYAVLLGLSNNESKPATEMLVELMITALPVSDTYSGYKSLLSNYEDSIALSAALFPELLQLTRLDGMRTPVYQILSQAVLAGKVAPQTYKNHISDILLDARFQLNKVLASSENKKGNDYGVSNVWAVDNYSRLNLTESDDTQSADKNTATLPPIAYSFKSPWNSLYHMAIILLPHHKKHSGVQQFFNSLLSSPMTTMHAALYPELWRRKLLPVSDSVVRVLSADVHTRIVFHDAMNRAGMADMIPGPYSTPESLAQSIAMRSIDKSAMDTIVCMKKVRVDDSRKPWDLYYFKYRSKSETLWNVSYVGIYTTSGGRVSYVPVISLKSGKFERDEEWADKMKTILRTAQQKYRKRINVSDYSSAKNDD